MGSAALKPDRYSVARLLLAALHHHAKQGCPDMDIAAMVSDLEAALDDLRTREDTLIFLSAYLGRCLLGSPPNLDHWEP